MKDLSELTRINQEAEEHERRLLLHRIAGLEVALHIPRSDLTSAPWATLHKRYENLRAQAAQLVDPNDTNWSQDVSHIYWEKVNGTAKPQPLFHV